MTANRPPDGAPSAAGHAGTEQDRSALAGAGRREDQRVAVLGLGEAGRRYAADLAAAGASVTGYDPAPDAPSVPGVRRAHSPGEAVEGAELVLGLTGAAYGVSAAAEVAYALSPYACFADLNSSAPSEKNEVERTLRHSGALVADVAVLAPVDRAGAATPLLASGPGAAAVGAALRPLGADVTVLESEPVGAAAGRKLLRSVFMKGLAAAVLESVTAGAAAGCEEWMRDQIAGELGPAGPGLVERLINGSRTHAARRVHEVRASKNYLEGLGARTPVCSATLEWLETLAAEPAGHDKGKAGHAA
jgi:3-hydroxyisobutyrate dehydrogenase-like beta-hydroxyacid dehydrogenase